MNRLLATLVLTVCGLVGPYHVLALADQTSNAFAGRYDNPEDVFALGDYIRAASEDGQFDQALSSIEEHLVRHGNDGRARLAAARLYANLGSWDLARDQADAALATGQLGGDETEEATRLRNRAFRAANGVEWFVDLTAGVRVSTIDVDEETPLSTWRDRTTTGAYGAAEGAIRFDLGTPLGNALIVSGRGELVRRYEDAFLGVGPGTTGDEVTAGRARIAVTYDMGLPVTAIDAARLQLSAVADYRTFTPDIEDVALGGVVRLVLQPTVNTRLHGEVGYFDLSASSGIPSDRRLTWEIGAQLRLSQAHALGAAVRELYEDDDASVEVARVSEVELSYAGILPVRPFGAVWTHQVTGALGTFETRDLSFAARYTGDHWRVGWHHAFHLDGANRFELDYTATRQDFDPSAVVPALAGRSSLTHEVGLSYTRRF